MLCYRAWADAIMMSRAMSAPTIAEIFIEADHVRIELEIGLGSLPMATDMMVWNITKEEITERMAVSPEAAWDVPGPNKAPPPDRTRKSEYTQFILDGKFDTSDVDKRWLMKFMMENNLTEDDLKAGQ